MKYQKVLRVIDSATATTSSQAVNIEDANKVVIVGKRSNHSAGSTAFSVDVSIDGTNWIAYNKLIDNVTNTNGQNLTRVASKSLSSDTTVFLTMDLGGGDTFPYMRVTATETTDGTHDAWVIVQY